MEVLDFPCRDIELPSSNKRGRVLLLCETTLGVIVDIVPRALEGTIPIGVVAGVQGRRPVLLQDVRRALGSGVVSLPM